MLRRNLAPRIVAATRDTPVVLLHGARQTGKSTLVKQIGGAARAYVTLDETTALASASHDAASFLESFDGPIVLDEVQRAPGLFTAIKASVDRDRTPGRYLLTGSANVLLVPRVSESLAGRVEILTLWPLSQGEIGGRSERFIDAVFGARAPRVPKAERSGGSLSERILAGGYPEPLARKDASRRGAWFESYLTTVLQRDVRELANIDGLTELPRLLALLASRTAGLLNFADIARGLSMPQSTLKRYFALLESTFLVVLVPAWSTNMGLRLTKAPKLMLADTGLACHVLGMNAQRMKTDANLRGALLENFVAMELTKQLAWAETRARLFHFRTTAGREVDLVLEDSAGRIVGIEVKAAGSVGDDDFRGLRALQEAAGDRFHRGIVLHDGEEGIQFAPQLMAAPVDWLWRV